MTPSELSVRAQQLLDDEVLQRALALLEQDAANVVKQADLTDAAKCIAAIANYQAATEIRDQLTRATKAQEYADHKGPAVA